MNEKKRKSTYQIKGFKEGLLITLGDGDWSDVQSQLLCQIDEEENFFNGARVAIEVGERVLHAAEMAKLRDELSNRDVRLFAILSNSRKNDMNAESLALKTRKSILKDNLQGFAPVVHDGDHAILLQKTIRSGTSIKYSGHVLVDGDLNPGGEILTTGSIYIWGKLRGFVHAGMDGSKKEVICAMELDPIKMRIANIEIKNSKLFYKFKRKPIKIKIENGNIIWDYWSDKRK